MKPFNEILYNRRSIRKFKPRLVSDDLIDKIINAAITAPSPSNCQPVRFIQISSPEMREKLKKSMRNGKIKLIEKLDIIKEKDIKNREEKINYKRLRNNINAYYRYSSFMLDAPLLFVVCTEKIKGFTYKLFNANLIENIENRSIENLTIGLSIMTLILKAEEFNLGTCILTAPLNFILDIYDILGIEDLKVSCFISAGYPDEKPINPGRKNISSILMKI